MIQTIRNAWKVPELKKKILFTIMALLIFRLGSAIPVPYIDGESLKQYMDSQTGILGLMNAMSGSAFSMATVFALSIQPYINSSIIIELLGRRSPPSPGTPPWLSPWFRALATMPWSTAMAWSTAAP